MIPEPKNSRKSSVKFADEHSPTIKTEEAESPALPGAKKRTTFENSKKAKSMLVDMEIRESISLSDEEDKQTETEG